MAIESGPEVLAVEFETERREKERCEKQFNTILLKYGSESERVEETNGAQRWTRRKSRSDAQCEKKKKKN